jgi:hypothetical protein
LWCDAEAADYAREALSVPGLRLLLRVDSERRRAGVATARETRYFASSPDPAGVTPADLLALVRGHWSVENQLQHIKDRWWDEDRHSLRRPGLAERFAVLTGAALAVLRLTRRDAQQPVRARADELSHDPGQGIKLITDKIF